MSAGEVGSQGKMARPREILSTLRRVVARSPGRRIPSRGGVSPNGQTWSESDGVLTLLVMGLLIGASLLLVAFPESVHAPHPSLLPSFNEDPALWPAVENRDRLVHAFFIFAAVLGLFIGRRGWRSNRDASPRSMVRNSLLTVLGTAVVFVQLGASDERLGFVPEAFVGFGYLDLTVLGLVLTAWVVRWPGPVCSDFVRGALLVAGVGLGAWRLIGLIRVESGVMDSFHVSFVANELLSVRAGRLPLFDFVAQYTSGLGYVFAGFDWLLPMGAVANLFVFVTALNLAIVVTVVLGIRWAWRSWSASVWPGLLVVAALTFSTRGYELRAGSSPLNYWANMPIRTTGLAFVVAGVVLLHAKAASWRREFGAGLLILVAAAVNVESAVAVLLGLIGVRFAQRGLDSRLMGSMMLFMGPSLVAVAGLAVVQHLVDSNCDPGCAVEFIRLFGAIGFYSANMPVIGAHLVLLTGFVLSAAVAARTLGTSSSDEEGRRLGRIAVLTVGVSLYGLGAASYYVNRSYAILLTPLFPSFALAASGLCTLLRPGQRMKGRERLRLVAPLTVALLPLTFLLHQTAPGDELARLRGSFVGFGPESVYPYVADVEGMSEVVAEIVDQYQIGRDQIGISSYSLMPLALRHDITPALVYNSPGSIITEVQMSRQCEEFWQSDLEIVLVHPQGMHYSVEPALTCGSFVFDRVMDPAFVVYRRSRISESLRVASEGAVAAGLFSEIVQDGVALIVDPRVWTGHGGLHPRIENSQDTVTLLTTAPEFVACYQHRRCDSEGRVLEVLAAAQVGDDWLIGRFPVVDQGTSLTGLVVTLDGAWLAGRPMLLIGCAAGIASESEMEGVVVRECEGGRSTVAPLEDWLTNGCAEPRNPWLCPIDPEFEALAGAALGAGLFDRVAGETLVVAGGDSWRDKGDHFLEGLLVDHDVVVVDGIPSEAVLCGIAAMCDADGRRLFLLNMVRRGSENLLVAAPVAGLGENLDQVVVMVNTSWMFGRVSNLPVCDIGGAEVDMPQDESEWAVRACSPVTPTQVSGFLNWVVDGCDGRPGWWLCP